MRSPHRAGARVLGATILVSLTMAALGDNATVANQHLASEDGPKATEPKLPKTIVIDPAEHTMLVDGRRSLCSVRLEPRSSARTRA